MTLAGRALCRAASRPWPRRRRCRPAPPSRRLCRSAAGEQQAPGGQPRQRQAPPSLPRTGAPGAGWQFAAGTISASWKHAVGVLAEDRHLGAVHFLTGLAGGAAAAGDDRVHARPRRRRCTFSTPSPTASTTPAPSEPRIGRQRPFGQAAGDEHVQVVEGHVAEAAPALRAGRRRARAVRRSAESSGRRSPPVPTRAPEQGSGSLADGASGMSS